MMNNLAINKKYFLNGHKPCNKVMIKNRNQMLNNYIQRQIKAFINMTLVIKELLI